MKKILAAILASVLFISLSGCSGNLIDQVLADLPIAADISISIVNIVSSGKAEYVQEVTEYSGKVSTDLRLIGSLVSQYREQVIGDREQGKAKTMTPAVLTQMNAALNDAQVNLTSILTVVGVGDPKVTAAVAAAVASVKLILSDVALLVKQQAPPAVIAQLFFGLGMPGVEFMGIQTARVAQPGSPARGGSSRAGVEAPSAVSSQGSGKSARQIAREYNQKIAKDFPKARVSVPKAKLLGMPVPMTGGK